MGKRDNLQVAMKKFWMRTGSRVKMARSEGQENLALGQDNQSSALADASRGKAGDSQGEGEIVEFVENEDPAKRRVKLPRRVGRLERWFNKQRTFWNPPLSADERDDQAIRKNAKRNFQARKLDCVALDRKIVNCFFNCGINYSRRSGYRHEKEKIEMVAFDSWGWTQDNATAIGKIKSIPYSHRPDELVDPRNLNALMVAVEKPVAGRLDSSGGGIYISVALSGRLDLPDLVSFRDILPLIAEDQPALSFFCGVSENGAKQIVDLEPLPHLLVGGSTGSGKSVMLTNIVGTLISRNDPQAVRLLLCDLKRVELPLFAGAPHLLVDTIAELPDGVLRNENQVLPLFRFLKFENDRRQTLFEKRRLRNLAEWNRKNRKLHLPFLVVVVDELARLTRNRFEKQELVDLLYDLAATSRSSGIHCIFSTQYAVSKFIDTDVKMNVPARIGFNTPDLAGSVALVDNGDCVGLAPAGRGIFAFGNRRFKFQSPLVTTGQIDEIVRLAKLGKRSVNISADESVSPEELVGWSVHENNNYLQTSITFHHFTPRIEAGNLKKLLQEMDGKIYTIDGIDYRVIAPAGARGRKLVRVELEQETEEAI